MEAEASADDLGVVADEERAVGEERWDVAEVVVGNLTVAIEQELRGVALREGVFGDALIGEVVVEDLHNMLVASA